jgi:hypothetical protein
VALVAAVEEGSAVAEAADSEGEALTMDLEKCIRQFVLIASKNVKYHSSQQKANQFIASSVFSKEKMLKTAVQDLGQDEKNNQNKLKKQVRVKMILNHLNLMASK